MKAVAAMYLFQPHRVARDFRGIRNEFSENLFLEQHNVVPYHSACYANYKFDFLIRNNKIERKISIFRYYILASLASLHCDNRAMFALCRSQQNTASTKIVNAVADEVSFANFCIFTAGHMNALLSAKFGGSLDQVSRERIRDTLRSESFSAEFKEGLQVSNKSK
jgi:hypothetical protein